MGFPIIVRKKNPGLKAMERSQTEEIAKKAAALQTYVNRCLEIAAEENLTFKDIAMAMQALMSKIQKFVDDRSIKELYAEETKEENNDEPTPTPTPAPGQEPGSGATETPQP